MLTTAHNLVHEEGSPLAIEAAAKPQLIERIFTDQHGRQFRMVFMVAVVDGELKGKLVSVHPISAASAKLHGTASSGVICLPTECSIKEGDTLYIQHVAPIVSPYTSTEFLINTQPTRAPSFY
jgi:hypothetical protein